MGFMSLEATKRILKRKEQTQEIGSLQKKHKK